MQFPKDYAVVSVDYGGRVNIHNSYSVGQEQQADNEAKELLKNSLTIVETYVMMKVTSHNNNTVKKICEKS